MAGRGAGIYGPRANKDDAVACVADNLHHPGDVAYAACWVAGHLVHPAHAADAASWEACNPAHQMNLAIEVAGDWGAVAAANPEVRYATGKLDLPARRLCHL